MTKWAERRINTRIALRVIPDLIRNLGFTTLVTWIKLEILKQVQDDKMGADKNEDCPACHSGLDPESRFYYSCYVD